jgi:hypothetical protein
VAYGPSRDKNSLFPTASTPALGPTQPPIQWVQGDLSRGVKLTTQLQLVPRSGKCGSVHPLSHTPSWCSAKLVKHRVNFTFLRSLKEALCYKPETRGFDSR